MSTAVYSPAKAMFQEGYNHDENMEESFIETSQSQEVSDEGWRAIVKIIQDVGPTLLPDEELSDLAAAEGAVNEKVAERNAIVDRLGDELRQLTRQLHLATTASARPSTHPTPEEHDAQVQTLESQQFSLGKSLNEEQASMTKKEAELAKVKVDREEIGQDEVGEDEWISGKAIRLKLLGEAGFSLIPPKEAGAAPKILIRNDTKEDIHTIGVEKNRSKVHYANLLWSLAGE